MRKFFSFLLLLLPIGVVAQSLKIKNGTDYPFTEVQMNYEEHSTGNLLEKYNQNKPLAIGQTLTLPNCKAFGAGDPLEFNISAIDSDGDIYVYGVVDICKTREIVFSMQHFVEQDPETELMGHVAQANRALYDQFIEMMNAKFLPALKTGTLAKVKTFFQNEDNIFIEGVERFMPMHLTRAKGWLVASNPEVAPNMLGDMTQDITPAVFVGKNYGDENEVGYYFWFGQNEEGTWKVRGIFDASLYKTMAEEERTRFSQEDDANMAEDSEMIYFISNTAEEFAQLIRARNNVALRKLCINKQLGDTVVGALGFLNENLERFSSDRTEEVIEVNGKQMQAQYTITISSPENEDGDASAYIFYFGEDDNGELRIIGILAAG